MKAMTALGVLVETPSATPRPYRLMGGQISSVWFDRYDLHPDSKEHVESIEETFAKLDAFVTKFIASGTPPDKVVIGGFSMGGGMALQYAFRTKHKLGGVFALSSYVNTDAAVYKLIAAANKDSLPPVFMRHGAADDFILTDWGRGTADHLSKLGVQVQFETVPGVAHMLVRSTTNELRNWLSERLVRP